MNRTLFGLTAALSCACAFGQALPGTVTAETAKLVFHVSTPKAADSLDRELRTAVAELRKASGSGRIVKLRVFVAAGNDAGAVSGRVAAIFSQAHARLPVVNTIQIGALEGGARVLAESVSESKRVENASGLAFISGQLTQTPKEGGKLLTAVAPLAEKSLANIKSALAANGLDAADVVRVTCFTSSLGDSVQIRGMISAAFPHAVRGLLQLEREAAGNEVECESVARLKTTPAQPMRLVNPANAQFAQMAIVAAPRIVFTTTTAGGNDDAGIRQMFTALKAALESGGSSPGQVFYTHGYPANAAMVQKFRDIRWEFFDKSRAPASTNLVFEGVPPAGSGAGIDAIALPN